MSLRRTPWDYFGYAFVVLEAILKKSELIQCSVDKTFSTTKSYMCCIEN